MWNGSLQKKSRRTEQNRCVNAGLPELTIVSVPGSLFLSYNPYGDALFLSIVYTRNGNRYSKECKQLDTVAYVLDSDVTPEVRKAAAQHVQQQLAECMQEWDVPLMKSAIPEKDKYEYLDEAASHLMQVLDDPESITG